MTIRYCWAVPFLLLATAVFAQESEPEARPEPAVQTAPAEVAPVQPIPVQASPSPTAPTRTAPVPAVPVQRADPAVVNAQYALAVKRANGEDGPVDYATAARLFASAARGGHVEARQQLAFMQAMGLVTATQVEIPADSAYRIQVASVPNEPEAAREWRRLQRRHPDVLGPLQTVVVAFEGANGERMFRVQGGPLDEDGARIACGRLRGEGATCLIVRPQAAQ